MKKPLGNSLDLKDEDRMDLAIYRALDNPIPSSRIVDVARLRSNEEREVFLEITLAKPINLEVVLYMGASSS